MSKPTPEEHTPHVPGADADALAHNDLPEPGDVDSYPYDPDASELDWDGFLHSLSDAEPLDPVTLAIDSVESARFVVSQAQAAELRALARAWELARAELGPNPRSSDVELTFRSLVSELAVAMHVSDRTMAARLNEAERLTSNFPATLDALSRGQVELAHVRVIADAGVLIEDAHDRARFEGAVLERARSITPGRLRKLARSAAEELATEPLQQRHDRANEQRRVWTVDIGDGMTQLTAVLPSVHATAVWDRLTEQAKAVHAAGDPRTFDQLRADLAAELLLTGDVSTAPEAAHCPAHGIRAEVSISIPVLTLLGVSTEPATLTGGSPIDLVSARRLASDAPHLVRVLTNPVSDQVLAVDTYRPSTPLRRFLRARDGRCRHPACNRSPRRCDLDHTIEYQHGGATAADNLACLCRNHHTLKSIGAWKVKQVSPGVLQWTGPRGRVTIDRPDTPVRFN